jgi:hypothetical protein
MSIRPCISADGEHLPTAIIFDKRFDITPLSDHKPSDFVYVIIICFNYLFSFRFYSTENGFVTYTIIEKHFKDVLFPAIHRRQLDFATDANPVPPALLLLDGHPTRRKKELWEVAAGLNIDVFILPCHSSHLVQPLDKNPFSALKRCAVCRREW